MDFSAQRQNFLPDGRHHPFQNVRPDVRLCLVQYLLRRAVLHKLLQDKPVLAGLVLHHGIELSVRKCTGAALAKLHIGLRIKNSFLKKMFHFLRPKLHGVSPLIKNRRETVPRKYQSRKQPRRAGADDHRALLLRQPLSAANIIRMNREPISLLFYPAPLTVSVLEHLLFTGKSRVNGICIEKLRLLPGIDGPSDNLPFHRLLTVRPPGNLRRQRFLCVIHR